MGVSGRRMEGREVGEGGRVGMEEKEGERKIWVLKKFCEARSMKHIKSWRESCL